MVDAVNLDAVSAGLRSIKLLRCLVRDLFKLLAEGEGSSEKEPKEDQFLDNVQSLIGNISAQIRELEAACTLISHPSSQQSISLGNTSLLGQDPSLERTNQYSSLISAYRWSDKVHEYAAHANFLLTQNQIKRTHLGTFNNPQNITFRCRVPPLSVIHRRPNNIGHNLSVAQVDAFLQTVLRNFPQMSFEISRPFGSPTVLKLTLERVMKVFILFRGLIIEWVLCKGFNEDFQNEEGKLDIWVESRYEVFRKVTDHANSAMLHYTSPSHPDMAIRSFFGWLSNYTSLFTKPCRKCECRLQNGMPPTWRDFRHADEYHEICKP